MAKILAFPQTYQHRVRQLAAELFGQRQARQLKEIRFEAARLAERARQAGARRWQAVKIEDEFAQAVFERLEQLNQLVGHHLAVKVNVAGVRA